MERTTLIIIDLTGNYPEARISPEKPYWQQDRPVAVTQDPPARLEKPDPIPPKQSTNEN